MGSQIVLLRAQFRLNLWSNHISLDLNGSERRRVNLQSNDIFLDFHYSERIFLKFHDLSLRIALFDLDFPSQNSAQLI